MNDSDFLNKIHDPHFPYQNAGAHAPLWVDQALAAQLLREHGQSGRVIPHPDIKMIRR